MFSPDYMRMWAVYKAMPLVCQLYVDSNGCNTVMASCKNEDGIAWLLRVLSIEYRPYGNGPMSLRNQQGTRRRGRASRRRISRLLKEDTHGGDSSGKSRANDAGALGVKGDARRHRKESCT
jgi:hypothetical protein